MGDQKIASTIKNVFDEIQNLEVASIFDEILGQSIKKKDLERMDINSLKESVKLDSVNLYRLKLNEVFFDILGLTQEERLEVYRAVVDLVASRIKRAVSVRAKKKGDVDPEAVAESIVKRANVSMKRFPEDYLPREPESFILELEVPKTEDIVMGSDLDGFYVRVDGKELYRGWDQFTAEYIYYSILCGKALVRVPADEKLTIEAVSSFKKDLNRLRDEINRMVEITVPDAKIREEVRRIASRKVFDRLRG